MLLFLVTPCGLNPNENKKKKTRIFFYILQQKTSIAVCSKQMGDVVLMVFAYALNEINENWVMKIETNKLISIRKNVEYLGTNVSIKFPQINTVTRCDTTSFLHSDGRNSLASF